MADLNPSGAFSFAPATFPGYNSACYYPPSVQGASTLQRTLTANLVFAMPFFCRQSYTFSGLSVFQDGAGTTGNMRLGIYNDSTGLPGSLKQDVGAVAFPGSTGWRTVTATITLNPGWYWAANVADAALVTIGPDLGSNVTQQSVTLGEVLDSGLSTVIGGSPDWASSVIGIGALRATLAYGALPDPFGTLEAYDYNVPPLLFLAG